MNSTLLDTPRDLISTVVKELSNLGACYIRANGLPDYLPPDNLGALTPDATAIHEGVPLFVRVETSNSINQEHTKSTWETMFLMAARANGWFVVAVKAAQQEQGHTLLHQVCGDAKIAQLWTY